MNRPSRAGATHGIDTTSWMTLRWVRGTRYYRVHLEQDLWNSWLLTRVNGRRDSITIVAAVGGKGEAP